MYLDKYIIDPTKYEEEYEIGKGNFSTVSLVHPKSKDDIKYALKKIPYDSTDNDSQKFFIREVLIMSELKHPNLIKFLGFSFPTKRDRTFKIYSEFLENRTLIEKLNEEDSEKQLTATQKTIIVYGIASAMKYLHNKNIVHRDLKPENVFLDSNFEPVLSDFGLSKILNDDELKITGRLGTPYFMAPEMFSDEKDDVSITKKIDVYAFAVTLLSMFTTKYKFKGNQPRTIRQLVNYVIDGKRYQIPSEVPKFYRNLINKCWANDASERPSFDEIVDIFESSNDFMFEGSDEKKVKEFIRRTKNQLNSDEMMKANNTISSDEEIEETQEFVF